MKSIDKKILTEKLSEDQVEIKKTFGLYTVRLLKNSDDLLFLIEQIGEPWPIATLQCELNCAEFDGLGGVDTVDFVEVIFDLLEAI